MKEIKLYVGLNDMDTLSQKYDISIYFSILKNVCFRYHVPFSFTVSEGGFFFENGDYTQEQTLILSLIDVDEHVAREVAKDLCVFFHQESVMMTTSEIDAVFIRERL